MKIETGMFIGIGPEEERLYGVVVNGRGKEKELLVLPACAMRMKLSTVTPETSGRLPPMGEMRKFLEFWDKNGAIDTEGEPVLSLYHEFAEQLSAVNDPVGLSCKAYGCYGGYNSFECDWEASRDCLLKLIEIDYQPFYACTLGYIYYYGRCNNGVPQYDEAYRYYSMAAFGGNYEAIYKIADMFANGYYVTKDVNTAFSLVKKLYDDNFGFITHGEFLSAFADIALRMGKLLGSVLDLKDERNIREAYRYLLQADYAIRMRIATYDQSYGDDTVRKNVCRELDKMRKRYHETCDTDTDILYTAGLLELSLSKGTVVMRAEPGDRTVLRFRPQPDETENTTPRFLLTLPDLDYCGLCDELVFAVEHSARTIPEGEYIYDHMEDGVLYFSGRRVMSLDDITLELLEPDPARERETRLVGVRFEANGTICYFLTEDPSIGEGDTVEAQTESGKCKAHVVSAQTRKFSELPRPVDSYCYVTALKKA